MDRQDAKPRRPSLLAGEQTDPAARPAPARILADMQGRQSGPRDAAGTTHKRWLSAALLLAVAVATGWWWQSQPAARIAANPLPPLTADVGAARAAGEPVMPGAATIIEETFPLPKAVMGQPDTSPTHIALSDGTPNPFVAATTAPAAVPAKPVVSRPPARKPERIASSDEPNLFAILMGNIKPGQAPDEHHGSGLDALLQTMEADGPGMASAEQNRNGRPQRARSQQIQRNLRECPAANTAKGLKCRQDICAVYAGRDPACPANG